MTALYIILGVIAVLAVLLIIPVQAHLEYDKEFRLRVSYLFLSFSVLPVDEEKKRKKEEKASKKGKPKEEKQEKPQPPRSFEQTMDMIKTMLDALWKPIKKLCRGLTVKNIFLRLSVAEGDAAKTALSVGKLNAAVYSFYAFISNIFKVKTPDIKISPDYFGDENQMFVSATLSVKPCTVLAAAILFGVKFFIGSAKGTPQAPPQAAAEKQVSNANN